MTSNERQPGAPPNLILALTAQIAASYLSSHAVTSAEVPGMVFTIRQSLASLGGSGTTLASVKAGRRIAGKQASIPIAMPKPVDPHRSVFADHIVCMECHGKYKTLRRHLVSSHATTPGQYRTRWRLPATYPITAPKYAAARSAMAKDMGLGKRGRHGR